VGNVDGERRIPLDHDARQALAHSVITLFKTDVIRGAGCWRRLDDVGYETLQ
jgi:hypothetical protein